MAGPIFINYRRGENLRDAQHLATLLGKRFGEKRIFLDVRGIDGGEHWLHALEKQVAASDVMVALIGKSWIDVADDEGNRRLDNAHDFVRFEIAQALQRNIPVLPVLLDGAPMPKINQLPHDLMALTLFQAMPLRVESVVQDAEAIARRLKIMLDQRRRGGVSARVAAAVAAVVLAAGVAVGAYLANLFAPTWSSLQAQVTAAKEEAAKARDEAEKLRPAARERDQAYSALADAKKAADETRTITESLRTVVRERDQVQSALAEARQRVGELQQYIASLNGELVKARAESERLKAVESDRDQARKGLADANAKVVDLQRQVDAARRPDVRPRSGEQVQGDPLLRAAQSLRDSLANGQPCPFCPELMTLSAGSFTIGSPPSERDRNVNEGPPTNVHFRKPFAVGKYPVTRGEFASFANETGYRTDGCTTWQGNDWAMQSSRSWRSPGFDQDDRHPVVCVSWHDAKAYVTWLSGKTGKSYRLLSEAEREYATRAGTISPFWWGEAIEPAQANYDGRTVYGRGRAGEFRRRTLPVDFFKPNPWGVYGVHGNIWEWCEDAWVDSYTGLPLDGSPRAGANASAARVMRGGSWQSRPSSLRAASRGLELAYNRDAQIGFRVARAMDE